ncbi:MAG: biopolymer transporter ExbD [Planctomycetes bacterium]|nr:biopolymer transporter ExbD [Planctomycetota bacterium]
MKGLTDQLGEGSDQADLTPMIDCVFLLLLFFIVTSSLSEETNLFKIEMPKAAHSEIREVTQAITIVIEKTGKIAIGKDVIPDAALWDAIKSRYDAAPKDDKPLIIVKGDENCPYSKAILIMDIAQELGVEEITWAVEVK